MVDVDRIIKRQKRRRLAAGGAAAAGVGRRGRRSLPLSGSPAQAPRQPAAAPSSTARRSSAAGMAAQI
jgi:hypothetical protein